MERNLEQLLRTKRYRALQKLYGKVSDPIHALEKKEILSDEETQKLNHLKKERAEITNSMNKMRESYQVTWDFCRTKMMELKEKYHLQKHLCSFPCRRYLGCDWNDIIFERKKVTFQKARWSSGDSGKTIHTRACRWFFSVRADCEVRKSYNSL